MNSQANSSFISHHLSGLPSFHTGQKSLEWLSMWPFSRKKKEDKKQKILKKVIAGVIIGSAIGSIVGKKMMEKHEKENDED